MSMLEALQHLVQADSSQRESRDPSDVPPETYQEGHCHHEPDSHVATEGVFVYRTNIS